MSRSFPASSDSRHSTPERAGGLRVAGPRYLGVVVRVAGAVGGGYAWSVAFVLALGSMLARLGVARSEAVVTASMLGFVAYLLVLLWAFSVCSTLRMLLVLGASAGALALFGQLLAP